MSNQDPQLRYRLAAVRLRIARSQLLLQVADGYDDRLDDLLLFARQIGDDTAADNLVAFQAAQQACLDEAQRELLSLLGLEPEEPRP